MPLAVPVHLTAAFLRDGAVGLSSAEVALLIPVELFQVLGLLV